MKTLLEGVLIRLKEKASSLQYVDENWGQLDYYSPNMPVKYPCALVDIGQVNWTNEGNLQQIGVAQVRVLVAYLKPVNTSELSKKTFEIFNYMKEVHACLHGFAPAEHCGPATRQSCRLIPREDGLKMYELNFLVQLNDDTAQPITKLVPKPIVKLRPV